MRSNNIDKDKTTLSQKAMLIILGIFLSCLFIELGFRLAGYVIVVMQDPRNFILSNQKGVYRIMCLGESTTKSSPSSYPLQLEEVLNQSNIGIKFSVINRGLPSITSSYIVEHLEENLDKVNPDMVITMMGINDYAQHIPWEYGSLEHRLSFFESLRVYKLIRYLWLRILVKFERFKSGFLINAGNMKKAYFSLAKSYAEEENLVRSEILNNNNINEKEYLEKGYNYISQGKDKEAEIIFKKILVFNPSSYDGCIGLAWAYNRQNRMSDSESTYKKAIELNPNNITGYLQLGQRYSESSRYKEAEEIFKKAVKLDRSNVEANFRLGWTYKLLGDGQKSKEYFKRVVANLYPNNNDPAIDRIYGKLAVLYKELGQSQLAKEYYAKANSIRNQYYTPLTRVNYLKLRQILDRRGIKLICVQYPVRSVEPLKKIFNNDPGVIFVDNERIFKDAINKGDYKEYFTDIFGGDFGHCTAKGNRLLAENIANVIVKEYFRK